MLLLPKAIKWYAYLFPIGIHWKSKLSLVGHSDLIQVWARASHPRCLQATYGRFKSCHLHLSWANNYIYMHSNGRHFDLWCPLGRSQWPRSTHVNRPTRGKQQYTQNILMTGFWMICCHSSYLPVSNSNRLDLCHQSLQTEGQTDAGQQVIT